MASNSISLIPEHALALPTLDALSHGCVIANADGDIAYINAAFTAITGFTEHDTVGRPLAFAGGPFSECPLAEGIAYTLRTCESGAIESLCRHQQGPLFWCELTLSPVRGDARQLLFYIGILRSISVRKNAQEAQQTSDKRYRDLVSNLPAGVVVHGAGSEILEANSEASRILGLSVDQMKGLVAIDPRWRFEHEDGTAFVQSEYPVNRVLLTRTALQNLVIGIRQPGAVALVWVMCSAFPVFSQLGQLTEVVVSFTDVTNLKEAEKQLQRSQERLQLVLRGSSDAPWDWDLVTDTMYYSPRWWEILGYGVDELPADSQLWLRLIHPDDDAPTRKTMEQMLRPGTESFKVEFRLRNKQGRYVSVLCSGFILRDAAGKALRISGTNADLTERKHAEEQIHHLAFFDALTDLPNRRFMVEQLQKALLSHARSLLRGALLFIDLDHFKELNDTLGHEAGDQLLKLVAARLRTCLRETDMVARFGGDEFVVMLENLSKDPHGAAIEAERIGQKILETLGRGYVVSDRNYTGTPSIGIALFDAQTVGVDALLKQADLAMYQAKAMGRNTLRFFDASMQLAVDQRVALEADLREGLRCNQMVLYYQPQVNSQGQVLGAEALVRWLQPERGLVPPGDFIPLAEATGLIVPLGRWVFQQACAQIALWASDPAFDALYVSVNVSAYQFRDPGFVDQVLAALAQTGADPSRLKLELTESVLAENIEEMIDKMDALKGHGVGFALDDFGTGYSSLGYLKRLPLDQLKIDQSFVRDVLVDTSDATIARIIITLAHDFGLSVIAEGVETQEQRQFLADNGCYQYQGYYFGRPVPVEAFEAVVRKFRSP